MAFLFEINQIFNSLTNIIYVLKYPQKDLMMIMPENTFMFDSINDVFKSNDSGNAFFDIKNQKIYPKFRTHNLFACKQNIPVKENVVCLNNKENIPYTVTRSIFGDMIIELYSRDTKDQKETFVKILYSVFEYNAASSYKLVSAGRISYSPILVFIDYKNQSLDDSSQLLIARTDYNKIEKLNCVKKDDSFNSLCKSSIDFYDRAYGIKSK